MNLRVKEPLIELSAFERGIEPPFPGDQQSFDVAAVLRILSARKAIVIGTVLGALALALVSFLFITQTYSATAVLMLDQRKNAVEDVNAVLSGLPADATSLQNQIQVLTSRQLASRVVDKLKLDRDSEFNTEIATGFWGIFSSAGAIEIRRDEKGREVAINRLLKQLSVQQVGASTSMTISVASIDAAKSARLTNAVADAYVEDQIDTKFDATLKATEWLSNRARLTAAQVQTDEAAVQRYKADNGIVDTATGGSIVDQQTVSVSAQLITARADLAQKEAIYDRVLQLQRAGRAVEATQVVASPLIALLRGQDADLQRQEAELSTRYLPNHPRLIDIRSQRQDTKRKIAVEIARSIDGLASDVAVARANVQSLQQSLAQVQSKFENQNNASVQLKALESIAAASRSIYEGLLSRLKEVQGQEGIAAADSRIISRATVPTVPSPRFATVVGISIPASFVLAFLFAFMAEALDPSLRTTEHVDRYLGLPVLATVPELDARIASHSPADTVINQPSSSFAESIRGLYLGLSLESAKDAPKVVLVTSAVPGEGKTVVAVNLARLAARNGRRAIIIDADFRRPSVARTMKVAPSAGGIVDVLEGRSALEKCVVSDRQSKAFVLTGASKPGNPSDLMATDALQNLIAALRDTYDLVVIDSAPLLPVNDTLLLARLSDTALFVTQTGKTSRDAVVAALRQLNSTNAPVAGVVLTRTKIDPRYEYQSYLHAMPIAAPQTAVTWGERFRAAPASVASKLRSLVFQPNNTPSR
jgi:capsular exopolysaccharide synthesis family protein